MLAWSALVGQADKAKAPATREPGEGHMSASPDSKPKQLLHLVFGGELTSLDRTEFRDLDHLDIVGIYPNHAEALKAWKGAAQRTVDNAHMRYFIVHMHRLLDPETGQEREIG
jgi:hypothetical protein